MDEAELVFEKISQDETGGKETLRVHYNSRGIYFVSRVTRNRGQPPAFSYVEIDRAMLRTVMDHAGMKATERALSNRPVKA